MSILANRIPGEKRREPNNSRIFPSTLSQINVAIEQVEYNSAEIQLKGAAELVRVARGTDNIARYLGFISVVTV